MMNPVGFEFQNFELDSPSKEKSTLIDVTPLNSPAFRDEEESPRHTNKSFWTFEYYQQFFDVNTEEVKQRIVWSMVPSMGKNYLEQYIKPNPDLYGPIWICTTLIFTIAVSGNVANYLQYAPHGTYHWRYDFHLIFYAATAILTYAWFVPIALYAFIEWNNQSENSLSFLELLCAYGYSLSIYVPVCILSVIQVSWLQWGLILISSSLSALVLVSSIRSGVEGVKKIPVTAIVLILHYLLAIGFMLYFFHVPDVKSLQVVVTEKSLNATMH